MPGFDPDQVGKADSLGWQIWAVGQNYEPGSTYKLVAFAAAVELGGPLADGHGQLLRRQAEGSRRA